MPHAAAFESGRHPRILVAEDEPGIALGLEDTLRFEGYDVQIVTSGATASRRALEEPFDLILLDVMLPGRDGFEVCRQLRAARGCTCRSCSSRLGRRRRTVVTV